MSLPVYHEPEENTNGYSINLILVVFRCKLLWEAFVGVPSIFGVVLNSPGGGGDSSLPRATGNADGNSIALIFAFRFLSLLEIEWM